MGAIPVHHTETSDAAWDGPKAKANLKLNQPGTYYRKAFAWVDGDSDPTLKTSYRFIHHLVDSEGTIGGANLRGCFSGIGVLNGARGGTTVPETDKKGIWRHLAAHLEDGDMEPAELKSGVQQVEIRALPQALEIRALGENGPIKLAGYAAVFNIPTEMPWGLEMIMPGAFTSSLNSDVWALWAHDPVYVLGRTKNGTLSLLEDDKGLFVEITPPDTDWAKMAIESIRRGDVDQMSYGFIPINVSWEMRDGKDIRIIRKVELLEVSATPYPAYPQTHIQIRMVKERCEQCKHDREFSLELAKRRLEQLERNFK